MTKQTKDLKIYLKVTPEEHSSIKSKAKSCGMTITQMTKYLLLHNKMRIEME